MHYEMLVCRLCGIIVQDFYRIVAPVCLTCAVGFVEQGRLNIELCFNIDDSQRQEQSKQRPA